MVSSRKKISFWGLKLQGSCEWVDFDGVFLHVKHRSFLVVLVLDVMYDMKSEKRGVKTVFLYGKLVEQIYM